MAFTLTQIVNKAFRESGITPVGVNPDTPEFDEAFDVLASIMTSLFGYEIGENLVDVNYGTYGLTNSAGIGADSSASFTKYAPVNSRIFFNINQATTIYLPPLPMDGARIDIRDNAGTFATSNLTINANGRKIQNPTSSATAATAVMNTNSQFAGWFYRADLGYWSTLDLFNPSATSPFSSDFDDLLIFMLARRLNPRYGADNPQLELRISDLSKKLRSRYRQSKTMGSETAILLLPSRYDLGPSTFTKGS